MEAQEVNSLEVNHAEILERVRGYIADSSAPPTYWPDAAKDMAAVMAMAVEYKAQADRLEESIANPRLAGLNLYNHTLEIGMEGGPVQMFSEAFAQQFVKAGAKNYIEMTMKSIEPGIGELLVTLQRREGKTPHQLRTEAEQALRAALVARNGDLTDDQFESVCEAVAGALGDAMDCTRNWSAWGCGSMSEDDFHVIAQDDSRLAAIARAAVDAMPKAAEPVVTAPPDGILHRALLEQMARTDFPAVAEERRG